MNLAQKEIQEQAAVASMDIREEDWKIFEPGDEPELILRLNYEYARSFRPVVEAVLALRTPPPNGSRPSRYSSIASYLHHFIPEFPEKPWKEVDPAIKQAEVKKLEDSGAAMFCTSACNLYPIEIFEEEILSRQRKLRLESYPDNEFTLFEIDYTRSERAILKAFEVCLKSRIESLKTRFPDAGVGTEVNRTRGTRENKRVLSDRLQALAGARVILDTLKPEYAQAKTKCELYADEQAAWRRAEGRALDCLQRLEAIWRFGGRIANPMLVRERMPERVVFRGQEVLYDPPLSGDEIKTEQLTSLKERFGDRFISPNQLRRLLTLSP